MYDQRAIHAYMITEYAKTQPLTDWVLIKKPLFNARREVPSDHAETLRHLAQSARKLK